MLREASRKLQQHARRVPDGMRVGCVFGIVEHTAHALACTGQGQACTGLEMEPEQRRSSTDAEYDDSPEEPRALMSDHLICSIQTCV